MKYDAVVIGGGPAGSVAAIVMARTGLKIALVDSSAGSPVRKIGESLPAAARPLLAKLKLLDVVENGAHMSSFGNVSVWGSNHIHHSDSLLDPNGLGWHLDRSRFDADLRDAAEQEGVKIYEQRFLTSERIEDLWHIQLDATRLETEFIVDASGRSSIFAKHLGVGRHIDDDLRSVFAWTKPSEKVTNRQTWIEACADGWWYTALLPDQSRILAFQTLPDVAGLLRDPHAFEMKLAQTQHLKEYMGKFELETPIFMGASGGSRLEHFHGDGWLAAGDAALSFDPLSSQGLFNALYTGMKAGKTVPLTIGGRLDAAEEYSWRLDSIYAAYLRHRSLYYASERRWPAEKFWAARTATIFSAGPLARAGATSVSKSG